MKSDSIGRVALNKGQFALVDEADIPMLAEYRWFVGGRGYAVRYYREDGKRKCQLMHRFLLNPPDGMDVDHINGNPLDNRRENLRVCTRRENLINRRPWKVKSSRFKGVQAIPSADGTKIYWRVNCDTTHIGHCDTEEAAARMYDRAAWERFGEFAKFNFPDEDPSKHPPITCTNHWYRGGPACTRCGKPTPTHYRYRKNKPRKSDVKVG